MSIIEQFQNFLSMVRCSQCRLCLPTFAQLCPKAEFQHSLAQAMPSCGCCVVPGTEPCTRIPEWRITDKYVLNKWVQKWISVNWIKMHFLSRKKSESDCLSQALRRLWQSSVLCWWLYGLWVNSHWLAIGCKWNPSFSNEYLMFFLSKDLVVSPTLALTN